jgi:type I restriction enzyme S subunit
MSAVETKLRTNWKLVELREVGKIVTGSTPPKARQEYYGGSFPFVKPGELLQCPVSDSADRLSDAGSEVADVVPAGGVLVSCIGNLGKVGLATRSVAFNQQINAIIPHVPEHSKWVFYAVQTPDFASQLAAVSSATTIAIVNKGKFSTLRIPLAPGNEQRRIVAEIEKQFTRLDAGVAALRRVQANLKRYRAAILKAACEGRLVAAKTVWQQKPITTALLSIDQGWSPKCENNPSNGSDEWAVITTTAIQNLQFRDFENKKLPASLKPRPLLELVPGDLLVTRAGPRSRVGIACLVKRTRPKLMLCDKAYRLRNKQDVASAAFLEVVLNSPNVVDAINKLKTGISDSGVNLTQKGFGQLLIPIPPLAEQKRIVAEVERRLSVIDELETLATANLTRATRLRQSILGSAFCGETT